MKLLTAAVMSIAATTAAQTASAADLVYRGSAVVTARSAGADCVGEYDLGEAFEVIYRPQIDGAPRQERLQGVGPTGAYLITGTSSGGLLRGAKAQKARIDGVDRALPLTIASTSVQLTASPSTITATTDYVTLTGYVDNLGIEGCRVTFRMSLSRLP